MHAIKAVKRELVYTLAYREYPTVVVASTGRAGSTMVFTAIVDGLVKHRFPGTGTGLVARKLRRWSSCFVPRLERLADSRCVIAKTHDVLESRSDRDCRYVFVYGDPLEAAMSVQQVVASNGPSWFDKHQFHLRGAGSYRDLYHKDVLNYEGQLRSWLTQSSSDLICIDYEDIWREQLRLSAFLQFAVNMPPRQLRAPKIACADINYGLFERLRDLKDGLKRQYFESLAQVTPATAQRQTLPSTSWKLLPNRAC